MDDLASNYFQGIKQCANCGRKFRRDSTLGTVLYENLYLYEEPDRIDTYSGHYYPSILNPVIICIKCLKEIKRIYKKEPELDLSYKVDEFVLVVDHADL